MDYVLLWGHRVQSRPSCLCVQRASRGSSWRGTFSITTVRIVNDISLCYVLRQWLPPPLSSCFSSSASSSAASVASWWPQSWRSWTMWSRWTINIHMYNPSFWWSRKTNIKRKQFSRIAEFRTTRLQSFILFSGVQLLHSKHVHDGYLCPLLPWQVHHHSLHPLLHGVPVRGDILLWKENL